MILSDIECHHLLYSWRAVILLGISALLSVGTIVLLWGLKLHLAELGRPEREALSFAGAVGALGITTSTSTTKGSGLKSSVTCTGTPSNAVWWRGPMIGCGRALATMRRESRGQLKSNRSGPLSAAEIACPSFSGTRSRSRETSFPGLRSETWGTHSVLRFQHERDMGHPPTASPAAGGLPW